MVDSFDAVGPVAKPLRFGLLGFAVAAGGASLALVFEARPNSPFAYLTFGLVVNGVLMGFGAVAWGWTAVARKQWGRK